MLPLQDLQQVDDQARLEHRELVGVLGGGVCHLHSSRGGAQTRTWFICRMVYKAPGYVRLHVLCQNVRRVLPSDITNEKPCTHILR